MENILNREPQGLPNDHILMEQLQKEMSLLKPKLTITGNSSNDQIFAPINNSALKSTRNLTSESTTRSDEQEEKLRVLIEERDSLLKTGSYSIDDAVIVKLNTEIRSLLILG